jgi:glycosyltransferase involved in cell wall biosynthesis
MQTIFFLTSSLEFSGSARRLSLLAAGLPRDRFRSRVCVLGTEAPWVESLRRDGVEVDVLGWKRPLEFTPLLALRRLLADVKPSLVHAWDASAVRCLASLGWSLGRLTASEIAPPGRKPSWLDQRLLRRVGRVIAFGEADAERCRQSGVDRGRIFVAPFGVPTPRADAAAETRLDDGRVILAVGPVKPHKGLRDAVWALDILYFIFPEARLFVVGDGSDRSNLKAFVQRTGAPDRVRFLGPVDDVAPFLRRADVVWGPSPVGAGATAVLEASAAGRAVVAARRGGLAEVVVDGVTGLLFRPGDKADLARQTRRLLADPALAAAMGAAARRRAAESFPVASMVRRVAELYKEASKSAVAT